MPDAADPADISAERQPAATPADPSAAAARLDPAAAGVPTDGLAVEELSEGPRLRPVRRSGKGMGLPHRDAPVPPGERPSLDIARRVAELAEDKKAADIVVLDLSALTTLADHFVICSGGSERQLDAIADAVIEGLRAEGVRPIGREGAANSHWILVDFGAVVMHVFAPPERDYYQLERHWAEAKTVLRIQ